MEWSSWSRDRSLTKSSKSRYFNFSFKRKDNFCAFIFISSDCDCECLHNNETKKYKYDPGKIEWDQCSWQRSITIEDLKYHQLKWNEFEDEFVSLKINWNSYWIY